MMQSQGYLTGLQSQLAGQYSGLSGNYGGSTPSKTTDTYGWGTTVPNYSPTGMSAFTGRPGVPVGQYGYNQQTPQRGTGTGETAVPRGTPGTSGNNVEQQFRQLFPGNTLSPQQLAAAEPQLNAMGLRLLGPNAAGMRTKIQLPDGSVRDVIGGAGAGNNILQWMDAGGSSSGGSSFGGSSGGGMLQSAFGGGGGGAVGQNLADYGNIMSRFQGFADTGGFSEGDKANIRSRAVSPIRSIYSSARQGLDRQRALQGGYSPGYATALGRFSREQGQLSSDAATNAEAAIAEMTQRGKLAGMGGMASIYGATPGLSNMFGQQMLQGMGQQLQAGQLQNQLSLGLMDNQNRIGTIPGTFQNALGNIGGAINLGGQIGGAIYPWLNQGNNSTPWGV